jgi:phage shock protein E
MNPVLLAIMLSSVIVTTVSAQPKTSGQGRDGTNPLIDYQGYLSLASQTQPVRAKRLLPLAQFTAKAAQPETLVLDARSAQAFHEGHIGGAVNLPFPDFNAASLGRIVGANPNRPILIYCNNNFANNIRPVPTKVIQVALNIQTFINLRAYGYHNVWELADVVDLNDPAVGWIRATRPMQLGSKM